MPPIPPSFDAPSALDWDRPLYSVRQVSWATGLGGPFAGAFILGLTLGRLGRAREQRVAYASGAGATLAIALAALVLPTDFPDVLFFVIPALVFGALARSLLGREFSWHRPRGQATAPFLKALGASLATLPVTLLFFFAVASTVDLHPMNRLTIGRNEIFYEAFATRADAERLADFLRDDGLLTDQTEWSLTLNEGIHERVVISFAVADEAATDKAFVRDLDAPRKRVFGMLYPDRGVRFELRNAFGFLIRGIP